MEHTLIAEPEYYSKAATDIYKKIGRVYTWDQYKKNKAIGKKITILVIKLENMINKKFMDQFPNLKVIGTNTTGLNHIDLKAAEKKNVTVASLRGDTKFLSGVHATAELTWGLLLALIRNIPWSFETLKKGKWERDTNAGYELNGRVLGILGLGRLGKKVATYGKAFGMEVIAYDPHLKKSEFTKAKVKQVFMNDLFKKSDVLSCHVLLTDKTEDMVKERHFKMMKSNALFINTARGELIDEKALLKGLKNGWLAGAATDVIRNEHKIKKNLLSNHMVKFAKANRNLLLVHHLGGATYESWAKTEVFIANKIKKHFKNG